MTQLRTLAVVALLSVGLAGPAAAQGMHDHGSMSGNGMGSMKPDPKDNASTKEFKAADTAMMKDMDVPYTGDPDVDFRTHMIPHHKGAVAMAKVALKYAKDPATKAMAQKIIDDQTTEISDMEAWLKRHGK
ncbi:CopM family metallochaperone [Methylobacterium sp. NPDC080182]|uniref:CopM family metallochaperone n=1 Tax=Methylobacterium sp. NPDC080182 TaxID=3390590 RepID=UPI003D07F372